MSSGLSEGHLNHVEEPLPVPLWYVVHTRSRHENKVDAGLRDKGLETFLPKMTVPSRRRQRQCILEVPLFSGYLFVNTDLNLDSYYRIIRVPGVVRLLGLGGRCLPVPAETVQSIQAMVSSGQVYYPWPYLEKGRRVRIVEGPLSGAIGIVLERRDKKRRLVVAVELFHRAVAVELNDAVLEPW